MASQDLPKPDYAKNMKLIGHSDQGGRPDGVQLMVNKAPVPATDHQRTTPEPRRRHLRGGSEAAGSTLGPPAVRPSRPRPGDGSERR